MNHETQQRYSRRDALRFFGTVAVSAVAAAILPRPTSSHSEVTGEMPTTGGARPGPVGIPQAEGEGLAEVPTFGGTRPGPVRAALGLPSSGLGEMPTTGASRPGPVGAIFEQPVASGLGEMPTTGGARPGPVVQN